MTGSGGFVHHGPSYEDGASRFDDAGGDLENAEAQHAGLRGQVAEQLDGWEPGLGSGITQVEDTLAKALAAARKETRDTATGLRASNDTMAGTEARNTQLAQDVGRGMKNDTTPGGGSGASTGSGGDLLGDSEADRRDTGINKQIDDALLKVNPKFKPGESAYSQNCTGVVQAYELQRRGIDAHAGPLEMPLRSDRGGDGGRPVTAITAPWNSRLAPGSKSDIEQAFSEPGSRGVVAIEWNDGGGHVFNVENVGGQVRFVDGQPDPPVTDASYYFDIGHNTWYTRLDNLPTPSPERTRHYLEP